MEQFHQSGPVPKFVEQRPKNVEQLPKKWNRFCKRASVIQIVEQRVNIEHLKFSINSIIKQKYQLIVFNHKFT